jgi:VanZ family protein
MRVEPRYGLLTLVYVAAIWMLSSLPDLGAPKEGPLVLLVLNLGHAPLFAGLAFCVLRSLIEVGEVRGARYVVAFAVSGTCAALDEWHQSFVPGRDSSIGDFAMDLAGIAGMLLLLRLLALRKHRRQARDLASCDPAARPAMPPGVPFPARPALSATARHK